MESVEHQKPKPERCAYCDIPNPGDRHWKWEKDSRYKHGRRRRSRSNRLLERACVRELRSGLCHMQSGSSRHACRDEEAIRSCADKRT